MLFVHLRGHGGGSVANKWRLGKTENVCLQTFLVSFQMCYYLLSGLIKAIQLDYSEADKHLSNAIRKAPQNTAVGFKQTVSLTFFMAS